MANKSTLDLTFWNRLDSRTRDKEFDRSLKAELRDGLWMLARQWQIGELEAEDTGSPVFARLHWDFSRLDRLALADNPAQPISDEMPLEAEVERVQAQPDISLQIEMGRHFVRMLRQQLPAANRDAIIASFRAVAALKFIPIADQTPNDRYNNANLLSNRPLQQMVDAAILSGAIDGWALYRAIKAGHSASSFLNAPNAAVDAIGQQFFDWFNRRYSQPVDTSQGAWSPQRMEYRFATSAPQPAAPPAILHADEYFHGRLDWYNFDYAKTNALPATVANSLVQAPRPDRVEERHRHVIPGSIVFPGMPNARWWEFEDRSVNWARIEGKINETAKMALIEFGLLYSNDWFQLPMRTPVGSLVHLHPIVVTDTFGQRARIEHYENTAPATPHWSFFRVFDANRGTLQQQDQRLLIPPVVVNLQEGKPIEEVRFTRDEMANMVWGIETIVPNNLGGGINGFENAQATQQYFQQLDQATGGTDATPELDNNAAIRYQIATTVPENWIPFIPVRKEGSIQEITLRRAAMPRFLASFPARRVRPLSRLLRFGLEENPVRTYDLYEEEVPPAGVIVQLAWQRARWHDGRVVLWLGYHKTNGRGEGDSGLKFDQIQEKR